MHVAVIGAGASGLASARNLLKNGFTCEIFERNEAIGGTWYYTEESGMDEYGFPIYACMYEGLRTNLPKEVMGYSDYKITVPEDRSYITQEEMLEFLNKYADDHNLRPHIKFLSPVVEVHPLPENRWSLKILNLVTKTESVKDFDAVMICSGRFNEGEFPKFPGQNLFKGLQMHSHDFRKPAPFVGKKVLVIGAGPSGLDIAVILSKYAQKVILSHHLDKMSTVALPEKVILKPDVSGLLENGATFSDESVCEIDCIIYCTGYKYNYPFLHPDCEITIEDGVYIKPLFKMIVNIEYPTMCFIGIPHTSCSLPLYDLQIRFYMEYLNGTMKIPPKEKMYEETHADIIKRQNKGMTKKQYHLLNVDFVWDYYKNLSDSAKIENIWPAITKLRLESAKHIYGNLLEFRNDKYKIINKDEFVKI